ncbi:MAG: glycosyltransferase family 9 protein [Candidatus Omnitrophota bacterium]
MKNILVVRTDRIGETLLSTPVAAALKDEFPSGRVSMMVNPVARELIEGQPSIDKVVVYKPDAKRVKEIMALRKAFKGHDAVFVLNPRKEFHAAAFLAGIPIRVGYDRKWGALLTHRAEDRKHEAKKHEVEYNLDLLKQIGITPKRSTPFIAVNDRDEEEVGNMLRALDVSEKDLLVAMHPETSNYLKRWPREYFARLSQLLIESDIKVVMVSGSEESEFTQSTAFVLKNKPVDLSGKLKLKQLAALLKRCKVLVSSDSGPVHIASAVGTTVCALFGRQDKGSNPVRWGPYGEGHIIFQEDSLNRIYPDKVFEALKEKLL